MSGPPPCGVGCIVLDDGTCDCPSSGAAELRAAATASGNGNNLLILQCPWRMCAVNQPCCSVAPSSSIVGNSTKWIGQPLGSGQIVVLETAPNSLSGSVFLEKYGDASHTRLTTAGRLNLVSTTVPFDSYFVDSGTAVNYDIRNCNNC